jgi:hypothetical protein
MKNVLLEEISAIEHKIEWNISELERVKENLQKVQNGDINIYI